MSAKSPERDELVGLSINVKEHQVVFDKRIVLGKGEDTIPYGFLWSPSTGTSTISRTVIPTVIPTVPDNLLYTLIRPSDAVGEKTTVMDLMDCDVTIDDDEMMQTDDDDECEPTQIDNTDIDLMETDDESDIDFESERDSDIEFLNNDESEKELSFYRRFEKTV